MINAVVSMQVGILQHPLEKPQRSHGATSQSVHWLCEQSLQTKPIQKH